MDLSPFAGRRVTVAVPDATRPLDPAVIDRLVTGLVAVRANPTILVALGLHRPMTDRELAPLWDIARRTGAQLVQHDARDPDQLVAIGEQQAKRAASEASGDGWTGFAGPGPEGGRFHRSIAEADAVIAVGLVEPHQYAGFSGGSKTVAIGCAAEDTIARLHGLRLLREPGTRIGCIDGNPFQAELQRIAAPLSMWALQIVPGGGTYFGPVQEAFERAVAEASVLCFEEVEEELDWMHLRVPPAKAQSFYQASRAATYVALVDRPAIRRGGTLIVEAACPEGLGVGSGEVAFARALSRGRETLLSEMQSDRSIDGGEQRAYVLALALERARIEVLGAPPMPELAHLGITHATAIDRPGRGRRFDDPFHRVPRLGGQA
jgi:lactate racemase